MATPASPRTRNARIGAALAAAWLVGAGGMAHAQSRVTTPGALNRYEAPERGSEWFQSDSLDLRGRVRPAVGLTLDYAYLPYEVRAADGSRAAAVVEDALYLHLGGALVLFDRLRVGADLPAAVLQSGTSVTDQGDAFVAPAGGAIGDLRLGADVRLLGAYGGPATLAVGTRLWLPTGSADRYVGDGAARLDGHVAVAGDVGPLAYAASVGALYRANDTPFASHARGSEIDFSVAAGARLSRGHLVVGPELWGGTNVSSKDALFGARTTPTAALLGAHVTIRDLRFGLGAGPGLSHAAGTGAFRALASVDWVPSPAPPPPPPDRDGDGVVDARDACPDQAGPDGNDPRTRGCPPPRDQDGDGIVDANDACPDVRGVASHDPGANGCPPDTDGDQVADSDDACPSVPGVRTDDPKTNGCPSDIDGDGLPDAEDACPDQAGARSSDPKTTGCPDRDGDGVVDARDACPDQPGPDDADDKKRGCPLARVDAGQVKITEQVHFASGRATILPESQDVVDAVAAVMKDHPEIERVRVEGYTDDQGVPAKNLALSQARARAVVAALVKAGVAAKRLEAEGLGQEHPIAPNDTDQGRAANRRVELHIVSTAPAAPPG